MTRDSVSISEAKAKLGELVKRVAYGNERIVLEFRNRPQAAIVAFSDLEKLEATESRTDQLLVLERLQQLRDRSKKRDGERTDAARELKEIREERISRF